MADIRAGSEAAFRQLVARHQRPLLNFFCRMGAYTCCEDLAQETFVRLWKYRQKYRPTAKFTTFLYTLARHVWLDHVRRQSRFQLFCRRYQEEIPPATDGGIRHLQAELDIQSALAKLNPKAREVLILAVCQNLSYADVAQILRIPVGTVKSRVFHALAALEEICREERL